MVEVFNFLDKGMEVNTNELEVPEAKALLLKIFAAADIAPTQPGFFQLPKAPAEQKLGFFKLMRHLYKERFQDILEHLEAHYPLAPGAAGEGEAEAAAKEAAPAEAEQTEARGAKHSILGEGGQS